MNTITVVGSGVMGKGIAYTCAVSGFEVYLNDINQEIVDKAKNDIYSLLEGSLQKGLFLKNNMGMQKTGFILKQI